MIFDYIVDSKHGPYYTIQSAVDATQRSWWRRLLHRFLFARIPVKPGIYADDVIHFPPKGKYHINGDDND